MLENLFSAKTERRNVCNVLDTMYIQFMRIAYLFNLPLSAASPWACEKVFLDLPAMRRAERAALIDRGGLRVGDVLVVAAKSQLGQGQESAMIQRKIEQLGATVEVQPLPKRPVEKRTGWLVPTDQQRLRFCPLWYSSEPASFVIDRASDVMGSAVDRNWMNRHCGSRTKKG